MPILTTVGNSRQALPLTVLALTVLAFAALLPGCRRQAIGTDVVVTIEEEDVHYSEFEAYLRNNVDSSDLPLGQSVLEKLFDQFLDERLLVRLALDRGLSDASAEGEPRVDQRAGVAFLLRRARPRPISAAEVEAYYEGHRDDFERPESVRLNQILVDRREDAEAALDALARGEDFEQVAARFSQVPVAHLGGERGALTRQDLPEAFADSIFELAEGEVSEVFDADYGFHLFQVVDRYPADRIPLEEVEDQIRQVLESRRLDELVASFVEEARGRYNVEIYLSNFPFEYRGFYAEIDSI